MKKRAVLILSTMLVVAAALFPMSGAGAGLQSQSEPAISAPPQPIPDMHSLLNYPYPAVIEELEVGPDRDAAILDLWGRPETQALVGEMADKEFLFTEPYVLANADAMTMRIDTDTGGVHLQGMTVTMVANELMGAITAMSCTDQGCEEGFYQAHFTNLDPLLAEVPDPPIVFNGMPYFFITTLRWVNGRIVYWRYWWFDSHHHPNWYYSHYFWHWRHWYWYYSGVDWPYWYWWAHGWYYWRYWYFWSTWFPWQQPLSPVPNGP